MTHPIETILDNLQTTFESIFNISGPVADAGNSVQPDNVCIVAGGEYVGVDRSYTVEIVTGGLSGIARCSITDSLGLDSTIVSVVIISDQPVSIGSYGANLTFTLGSDSLIVGDKWVIKCKNYYTNIKEVVEAEGTPTTLSALPGIAFAFSELPYDYPSSSGIKCDSVFMAELWVQQPDKNKVQRELVKGLSDIERALNLDVTRGGVAQDTKILSSKPFLPVPGSPFAALSVEIGIWFDHYIK